MASEVLPVVKDIPVLAGVNGTDPFRSMPRFLNQLKQMGFAGVQNFPTVGLIDGNFRQNLEETGMGFDLEVEMIAAAHEWDLLTSPYVFDEEQARNMVEAGADILVAHMGLTVKGTIGARTAMSLDDALLRVQAICDAAKSTRSDVIVLCHDRSDRRTRRCEVCTRSNSGRCRVLRRIQCGTASDRTGNYRPSARV